MLCQHLRLRTMASINNKAAIFLLGCVSTFSVSNAQSCYYPDGVQAIGNIQACQATSSTSSFSACCAPTDECLTNGLCKAVGMLSTTAFWRESCTDATWESDACPKYCYNESTSKFCPPKLNSASFEFPLRTYQLAADLETSQGQYGN